MRQMRTFTQEETNYLSNQAQKLHDTLYKRPINEDIIVEVLSNTTNEERQLIRSIYKQLYNHPIQNDINKGLTYRLKDLCINMFDTPYEYDARDLHKALHSYVNDDKTIVEIFASRTKNHLLIVDNAYKKFFNISLKEDIKNETSKEYTSFLLAIMETDRSLEQTISPNDAYIIAKSIVKNGLKIYGTDVNLFKQIFLEKSREDLILICRAFNELYKKNLYDSIEKEVGGKTRKLLKAILYAIITPAEWFAKKAFKAIEGLGTDVSGLYRVLINRAEIDMYAIRDYYFLDRKTDIKNDIEGDTSGAYGKILVNLSMK